MMLDFSNINIEKLSIQEMKEWYLSMVINDISIIKEFDSNSTQTKSVSGIKGSNSTQTESVSTSNMNFKDFLCGDSENGDVYHHETEFILYIKKKLVECQTSVRNGKPIVNAFTYSSPKVKSSVLNLAVDY